MDAKTLYKKLQESHQKGAYSQAYKYSRQLTSLYKNEQFLFNHAVICYKVNKINECLRSYENCLAINPNNKNAFKNYVVVLHYAKNYETLKHILESNHQELTDLEVSMYIDAVSASEANGQAKTELKRVLEPVKLQFKTIMKLLELYLLWGDLDEVEALLQRADATDICFLKLRYYSVCRVDAARQLLRDASERLTQANKINETSKSLLQLKEFRLLTQIAKDAIRQELPIEIPTALDYFTALIDSGRTDEAISFLADYRETVDQTDDINRALINLYIKLGDHQEAYRILETVAVRDDFIEADILLKKYAGNFAEMKGLYRRALKSKLLTPNILWTCADIWTTKDRDKTFGEYKKFFSGKNFNSQDEILQHHCMFEFYDRMGNYKKALDELQQANRKKNRINSFDFESFKKILDDTLCHVNKGNLFTPDSSETRPIPVFIIGMPRSGTTLIDAILNRSNEVEAFGELNSLNETVKIVSVDATATPEQSLDTYFKTYEVEHHLRKVSALREMRYFTDKAPLNFKWMQYLLSWRESSKIVYIKRDRNATRWSNYRTNFSSPGLTFTNCWETIGNVYDLHEDFMDEIISGEYGEYIYPISYEELIEMPIKVCRGLFNFLEIPWNPGYLEPGESDKPVMTASATQIRKKVYSGSNEQWLNYSPYLSLD